MLINNYIVHLSYFNYYLTNNNENTLEAFIYIYAK